jgi:YD repeat-containing protein
MLAFGNLSRGPNDHDDADGYSNYEEYNLGTDPKNSSSKPDADTYDEGVDYGMAAVDSQGGDGIIGKSVNILNGNAVEVRDDLRFPSPHRMGLIFRAYYNSRSPRSTELGYGWTHTYAVALETGFGTQSGNLIRIIDETGRVRYFLNNRAGLFAGYFNEKTDVVIESGDYVWNRRDGRRYRFSSTGKLLQIEDDAGNQLNLTYDGQNRLASVSDSSSGRSLIFHYNGSGLFAYITGPASTAVSNGRWIDSFGYDGNRNLTSVLYADGTGFDYYYTDADIHNLSMKKNKASHQLNTWSYDSQDRCTSYSERGSPIGINYMSATRVDVTDAYGQGRSYTIGEFGGQRRLAAMAGLAGASYLTGHNIKRWVFDDELNLIETETILGTINKWEDHDERGNPGTAILAYGSPEERLISYTYHPDWTCR